LHKILIGRGSDPRMNNTDSTAILVIIGIIVFIAIIAIASSSSSSGSTASTQRPSDSRGITQQNIPPSPPPPTPTFRVIQIQHPYTPASAPIKTEAPLEWGPWVERPPSVTVYHNQQTCIICTETINGTYKNTGWARCPITKKLIHGHCYDAWVKAKGGGCAVCQADDHEMKRLPYKQQLH